MQITDPTSVGYFIGRILAVLIFLLPIALCGMTLRRRRADVSCLLSLMLTLAPFPIFAATNFLPADMRLNRYIMGSIGLVVIGLWMASFVMAIIGLAGFKSRRSRFGRKRAILALVLNVIMCGVFAAVAITNILRGGMANTGAPGEASAPFISEKFNFRFTRPAPWIDFSVKANPNAIVGAMRGRPQVFFMVIAETPGAESALTTDSLVEGAKANAKSVALKSTVLRETPMKLHDMEGILLEEDADLTAGSFCYLQWVAVYHGYAYQLMAWAAKGERANLNKEGLALFQSFEVLHPNQIGHAPGMADAKDYQSLSSGFSVRLAGTEWNRPINKMFELYPTAEFGVCSSPANAFIVMPVPLLPGVQPDLGILTQACLGRFGVEYPGSSVHDVREITHGPLRGNALGFDPPSAPNLHYDAEILKGKEYAYLLLALSTKASYDKAKMADLLARVDFEQNPAPASVKNFTSREKEARGLFYNEIGLAYYKQEKIEQAEQAFRVAQSLASENPVVLLNVVDALIQRGKNREASEFLQANLHGKTKTNLLCAKLAWLKQQTGDVDGALELYSSAFDSGKFADESAMESYLGLLCQQNKPQEALAVVEKFAGEHDSLSIRLSQANVNTWLKKYDAALTRLHDLEKKYPDNNQVEAGIAKTLFAAERYVEASDWCEKVIKNGNATSAIWLIKGRSELGLKRYREAKVSLEASLEQDPSNRDTKSLLGWVSSMLGHGDTSALTTPIEPVAVPAELLAAPAVDGTSSYLSGFGVYYSNLVKAIAFKKDVELRSTEYRRIKVLNDAGVKEFSTFELPFDPISESIFVNELTVKDQDGATISTGKVEDCYLVDDTSSGQASQRKLLHIPISGLRPHCEVILTTTRRDFGAAKEFRFTQHFFSRQVPILRSSLFVQAAPAAYKTGASGGMESRATKTSANAVSWTKDQPPVMRFEAMQPSLDQYLPEISLDAPAGSWAEASKEYLASISSRLELDDATRRMAAEKTKGLENPQEKAAALIEAVQKDLTYTAIEFGPRARIPNLSQDTARNRYGDCKDHALLLRQLLEASGIKASLVLVNSGGDLHRDLPSLDQFNHMIVFIPSFRGGAFIDCTDKDSDLTTCIPAGLAKKEVLILDQENPRIAKIPDYPADSDGIGVKRRVEIINRKDLSVTEDLVMNGNAAAVFRNFYRRCEASSRKMTLQQQLAAGAPSIEIQEIKVENLEEHRSPLLLHLAYLVKGKFHNLGGQLVGQLPAVWERFFFPSQPIDQRRSPFEIIYPTRFNATTSVVLPAGYTKSAGKTLSENSKFTQCELRSAVQNNSLVLDCKIKRSAGRFAPSQYGEYSDSMSRVFDVLESNLILVESQKQAAAK